MNQLQKKYFEKKTIYEVAFKNHDWETVDAVEDEYLDAEFAMVEWMEKRIISTGQMTKEEIDYIRKNSNEEQWNKIVDMASRLQ